MHYLSIELEIEKRSVSAYSAEAIKVPPELLTACQNFLQLGSCSKKSDSRPYMSAPESTERCEPDHTFRV